MNMPQRETSIKAVVGVLLFCGTIISAALFADDRYAKAVDLRNLADSVKKDSRRATDNLRKQMLEDKIFELDLVPEDKRTDVQRAKLNRAISKLREVRGRLNQDDRRP